MSLWNDIQPWLDHDTGMVTASDGGKDNLILMTAHLWREMSRLKEDPSTLVHSVMAFYKNTEVVSGLWLRRPRDLTPNAVDNLIGACFIFPSAAQRALKHWNKYWTCFDVQAPNRIRLNSNFYGRFLGLGTYIRAAAGEKPNLFQRLIWIGSNYFTDWTASGDSDRLLMSLQSEIMRRYCPKTCARYDARNPVYTLYFGYFGANFPLTLWRKSK